MNAPTIDRSIDQQSTEQHYYYLLSVERLVKQQTRYYQQQASLSAHGFAFRLFRNNTPPHKIMLETMDHHRLSSPEQVQQRIQLWDRLAREKGWMIVKIQRRNTIQRQRYQKPFVSADQQFHIVLDGWPTTGTVGSYLKHPTQGKTQLFRRQCTDKEMIQIFQDPRSHTGKGYHQTKNSTDKDNNHRKNKKRGHQNILDDIDEQNDPTTARKRRRVACAFGQRCRNYDCRFSHPPRCFYAAQCWFQPHCWFDHTRGLCKFGIHCEREGCWFSHRNPDLYY